MGLQCDLALALADGPGEVVLADLAGDGDGYVGSLSNNPCYFAFIQAFLSGPSKLLICTVFGVYFGKSDTLKIKQSLLPMWEMYPQ